MQGQESVPWMVLAFNYVLVIQRSDKRLLANLETKASSMV